MIESVNNTLRNGELMKTTETTRNVLVAVDVQKDFIDGSLAVKEGEQVVDPLNGLAEDVRRKGGDVAFTRDWHPVTTPHFNTWPVHCVAYTEGAEFHPELIIEHGDTILSKGMGQTDGYSGCEGIADDSTTLETLVTPRDPKEKVRVFIGGLATDYCVLATAKDIAEKFHDDERVKIFLVRDAVRAVNARVGDEAAALKAMEEAKVIAMTSTEIREQFFAREGFTL